MKILSIITSSNICGAAVLEDEKLIKQIIINDERTHAVNLMPTIQKLFEETNLKISDMDLIVCDKGPGSFTGIRIGVATAKAFSDSLDIKSLGISSLEALAYNVKEKGFICSMIDAKNENVYVGVFENTGLQYILRREYSAENIHEFLKEFENKELIVIFVGDGAIKYEEEILKMMPNSIISSNEDLSAFNLGLAGYSHYKQNDKQDLLPLYLKKPKAEEQKKGCKEDE